MSVSSSPGVSEGLERVELERAFAPALLEWGARCGRVGLPWQTKDPYKVWLSEIMLQQTQVETVKLYFERFTQALPSLRSLAEASEQQVLSLWAGLGYYQRARNLQAAAKMVVERWGGDFPQTEEEIVLLPGVGPSTAAAIASICFGRKAAILDGNVQRALGRVFAIQDDLATAAGQKAYWALARRLAPEKQTALYTQSIMDLGATVCSPKAPRCEQCPFESRCLARRQGEPLAYPVKTKKKKERAQKSARWVAYEDGARLALVKNDEEKGVWRQLWTFPTDDGQTQARPWGSLKHVFSHYDLHLSLERKTLSPGELDALARERGWRVEDRSLVGAMAIPQPMRWALERLDGPGPEAQPAQTAAPGPQKAKAKSRRRVKEAKDSAEEAAGQSAVANGANQNNHRETK